MIGLCPQNCAEYRSRITPIAIITLLVLGLLAGLLHHHRSESEERDCSYCHAGIQTPVTGIAKALACPRFDAIGIVDLTPRSLYPSIARYSTLIPRAPPAISLPALFWEGYADLA